MLNPIPSEVDVGFSMGGFFQIQFMDAVLALADRITVLVYGESIACDTPENIRSNPEVRKAYLGDGEALTEIEEV